MICDIKAWNDLTKGPSIDSKKEGTHNRTLGDAKREMKSVRKTVPQV